MRLGLLDIWEPGWRSTGPMVNKARIMLALWRTVWNGREWVEFNDWAVLRSPEGRWWLAVSPASPWWTNRIARMLR